MWFLILLLLAKFLNSPPLVVCCVSMGADVCHWMIFWWNMNIVPLRQKEAFYFGPRFLICDVVSMTTADCVTPLVPVFLVGSWIRAYYYSCKALTFSVYSSYTITWLKLSVYTNGLSLQTHTMKCWPYNHPRWTFFFKNPLQSDVIFFPGLV